MKKWHSLLIDEIEKELKTNINTGLSEEEARKRLSIYGLNELRVNKKPTYVLFLEQFKNLLILILLIATAISAILGEVVEAVAIGIVVLVMGIMGFIQEYRAEKTLEALRKMATPITRVVRNGEEREIPSSMIVPGDIVVLKAGDIVPADIRLFQSVDLEIDETSFTGESAPVEKNAKVVLDEDVPVSDRINMAFMGTSVVNGYGKGIVVATGNNTELGKLAGMIAEGKEEKTPLEEELDYFAKRIGLLIIGISGVVFALSLLEGLQGIIDSLMTAIALAVAAIPEGLPAIATAILAIGAYRMAKKNALVRKLSAVETLGSVNVICTDKTGTITKGEMTLKQISFIDSSYMIEEDKTKISVVPSDGNFNEGNLEFLLSVIPPHVGDDAQIVSDNGRTILKGSPTEGAVLYAVYKLKGPGWIDERKRQHPVVKVYPFDRFRKMKSTVHKIDDKYLVITSGAPDVILSRSTRVLTRDGEVAIDKDTWNKLRLLIDELGSKGYRTFGVAYRWMSNFSDEYSDEEVENEFVFMAVLGIIDPPREGVAEAIKIARKAGIKVVMVTGDHKSTATAIAKMIGLDVDNGLVIEGRELDKMSEDELQRIIDKVVVFARATPEHKLRIVKAFKARGYRVAMTGDGVNDAPALKMADIGVAMGIKGTEVAKEASQIVLLDDNFSTIVEAIKEGRVIYENLKKPINFLLSCNLGEVATIFGAELLKMPIPLKPLHLLWVNVVTDVAPATVLGLEAPEPDIMDRPPRPVSDRLITKRKLIYYIAMGSIIGAALLLLYNVLLKEGLEIARTTVFTSLVVAEIGLVLTMRSETKHFWELPRNRWLLPGLAIAILLQLIVIYTPLREVFDIVYLDARHWALSLIVPIAIILVDALRKSLKIKL